MALAGPFAAGQRCTNGMGSVFALSLLAPEPSSAVLLGLGAIGLGATALRRGMRE